MIMSYLDGETEEDVICRINFRWLIGKLLLPTDQLGDNMQASMRTCHPISGLVESGD